MVFHGYQTRSYLTMNSDDWVKIIGAIGSALVLVLGAVGVLYAKVHQYSERVNGRLSELLELTRKSSRAEGKLEADPPTIRSSGPTEWHDI